MSVGDVPYNVDRSFLLRALIGIGRGGNYREAAEAGIGSLGEFFVSTSHAVRTPCPFAIGMGQSGIAGAADDVSRRLPNLLQQNLVDFNDAVIGVVRQDDVVDGVERIHPLPLRAQDLLEQTEVLYCERDLSRT